MTLKASRRKTPQAGNTPQVSPSRFRSTWEASMTTADTIRGLVKILWRYAALHFNVQKIVITPRFVEFHTTNPLTENRKWKL